MMKKSGRIPVRRRARGKVRRRRGSEAVAGIAEHLAAAAQLMAEVARPRRAKSEPGPGPMFLIEDTRGAGDGLFTMLGHEGLRVIAAPRTRSEALVAVERLRPQLVLLDAAAGDRGCLRLAAAFRKIDPAIRVVVMHLLPAREAIVDYMRSGVSGFVMRDASSEEFVATIRAVADGVSVLPALMARTLSAPAGALGPSRGRRSPKRATRMTARERQVTGLIAEGLGNRAIGARLGIAAHTVKSHVHNILEKLALHTRLEVAAYAHANAPVLAAR